MQWLFPFCTPFIPAKHVSPFIRSLVLSPRIAPLSPEDEKFFTPCKLLAYGEMNTTQRAVLRNILREDLVCI